MGEDFLYGSPIYTGDHVRGAWSPFTYSGPSLTSTRRV